MKTLLTFLLPILFISTILFNDTNAQVTVSGATAGNGNYTTLAASFNAINAGAQTGPNIFITITANTAEPATGAVLNNGTWTSLTIQPNATGRTISANVTGGLALVDLNGADRVTIDGMAFTNFTFSNTSISATAGTSTIRFRSDATDNKVRSCRIFGSSRTAINVDGGNISFAGNSTLTGNSNNTISNCDIGSANPTTNLPTKCVYSGGTAGFPNTGDTIRNCNIYDYFISTSSSAGIYLSTNTTGCVIKDNKFYQQSLRTTSSIVTHYAIAIGANATGSGFLVSGNIIGYASSAGTGNYSISGGVGFVFNVIAVGVDNFVASDVTGNIIKNIVSTGNTGIGTGAPFKAIYVSGGMVNVTGNTIGDQTSTGNINLSSAINCDVVMIYGVGNGDVVCSNNNIGSVNLAFTNSANYQNFYGIRASMNGAATFTCQNNIIRGTSGNSMNALATNSATNCYGIYVINPASNITGNTIRNITSAGGTGVDAGASVIGIAINTPSNDHTVSQNLIYNLTNTNTVNKCTVTGIYNNISSGTNLISRNFIHNNIVKSDSAVLIGIHANGGTATYQNNMISVASDTSGAGVNKGAVMNGINETAGTNNFFFNTVYVGGNPTTGTNNTFAFNSIVTTNIRNYRNNIFYNARSNNGSTGKHYAISVGGTAPNPAGLTSNHNLCLANGTGGVYGFFNSADVADRPAWQTATGQDIFSLITNPSLVNPAGSASGTDLHVNSTTPVEAIGFNIVSVTDDYDGQTRSTLTPEDIGADAGNFTSNLFVVVTGGISVNQRYESLTTAFIKINTIAQTGANIVISIDANITEPSTGAVLNNGAWSSLTIQPNASGRTVSANVNPGLPLIDLNGADNVTIDGMSFTNFTFSNTSTSATPGTSTIRFQNDATNNKINKCTILGSSSVAAASDGGSILFAGNSTTTGNDNNTVSNCDVGSASPTTNLPSKCIYFSGTSGFTNSGDTIRNCNIYNFFTVSGTSAGVYIGTGTTATVIKDNKFYQSGFRDFGNSGGQHSAILISNPSGSNFLISGNIIGYNSSLGSGNYSYRCGGGFGFVTDIISLNVDNSVASNVQGNVIRNISGNLNNGTGLFTFKAIFVNSGMVNVTGNSIGTQTNLGNLVFDNAQNCDIVMIYATGNGNVVCNNNNIGSVSVPLFYVTYFGSFYGIRASMSGAATFTCQNNTIGGTPGNSFQIIATNPAHRCYGIYIDNPVSNITGNIIRNFMGGGFFASTSVIGIAVNAPSNNHTISQNLIYNLTNTNTTHKCTVTGIYYKSSSGTNLISGNFIHNNIVKSDSAILIGIQADGGTATYQNNMISLASDTSGAGVNNGVVINGINETAGTNNFYFNSVYVGGNPTTGSNNTFAFTSAVTTNARNFRDNIFYNARSNNGSTGKHYSVRVGGTTPNPVGLTINNNIYLASGNGGVFGLFNGVDRNNLSVWQTAVGQDANSFENNPQYINPKGSASTVDLHINPSIGTSVEGNGFDIVSVTNDNDGQTRSSLTPVDIGADAGNFIQFTTNKILTMKMLVEGFYNSGSDQMIRDTVRVYLRNGSSPFAVIDSSMAYVDSAGNGIYAFTNASDGTPYYMQLKHRNSLETWSDSARSFVSGSLTYDFTPTDAKAFGNNMKQVDALPVEYAIYGGDVNQDGSVDATDLAAIDNDAFNFVTGYVNTDLTGDDVTDASDGAIADNNAFNFVSKVTP